MTTERNIIIHAGQAFTLSLDYAGTVGRGQRMHIRAADAASTVIAILTHNGDANARVIYDGSDSIDVTIGASVSGEWLVGANRVEWVYDIEDYDLSDADDVVITHRGKVIVYGNRTRPEDVTPSPQMPSGDGRYVRYDGLQGLTDAQKLQARENIGAGTGGGGGSGDVVGPASATDDRIAAFDGATGKLIKQGTVTATAVAAHLSNTSNPHGTTAAQVGADPAGTAASAVSTHNAVTVGAHGMTAFGASLVDDADASAARTTLGLGTAATASTGDFEAAGAVSTHNAVTTAHGISAFGASLVDDANAAAARTTLGLGTAATAATGDFAAASHAHAASDVTSGTLDAARLPAATETAQGAVELATTAEALTGTDTTRAVTAAGVKAVADTKAASSHTHAASDITSGTLAHERGGLEADVSAYSGLVKIAAGATSAVTVTAAGEALLDDADASAQRTTLGLGDAATKSVGTGAGTVAAGDHTHTQHTAQDTATWEAGVGTTESVVSPAKVAAAIAALASGGSPGGSSGQFQYNNASAFDGSPLWREDANTITQRNGTSAQAGRWANTWTDSSNYELGRIQWVSNVLTIGTLNAGTGSARAVAIQAGGVTAISIGTSAIVSIGALNISGAYGLAGNGSNPLYSFRYSQNATTLTSYTLTGGDSGVFYIATSGSDQTFTMPASPSAGMWYGFKVSSAKSSYLRFTANTGQKIRLAGGLSASAGYVRSNTGGSFVYLMYDSTDAEWVAWQQGGTWTIDS